MLLKCIKCEEEKEESEFLRNKKIRKKCKKCLYCEEFENRKNKMNGTESGDLFYVRKVLLKSAKIRSKVKSLDFNLTLDDLVNVKNKVCPISGQSIIYKCGVDNKRSASLDRIDPNKGYISGNISIISHEGNTLKNRNNLSSTIRIMKYIAKNLPPEELQELKKDKRYEDLFLLLEQFD